MWDVDFSLALRNRTGKYYIGRDVVLDNADLIAGLRYGRVRHIGTTPLKVPTGALRKFVEKASDAEMAAIKRWPSLPLGVRSRNPVLHLDPYTVLLYRQDPRDMVLCHDMGPLTHPELFDPQVTRLYDEAYRRISETQPSMVFVSRASRDAYVDLFGPLPRMEVIYPPLRPDLTEAETAPVEGLTAPFLLTVGSIGRRKNQAATIRAFARSGLAAQGVQYVLCGSREPGAEEVAELAETTEGVRLLSYVTDAQLAWLYKAAAGFVLVSRLEGFGVPVAEAIAAGLVPLVARDSVLEEVAGAGALRADPLNEADIAEGLRKLVSLDPEERATREADLARSIERFTPAAFRDGWRAALTRESQPAATKEFIE